jgi:glycosyltransferase involved in cell wall biosynthesis
MIDKSSRKSVNKLEICISVVIPVKNEAANLPSCLESLIAFDDILVVDSGSSDATCAIAEQHGCRSINFNWNGNFPKKRNWVLQTQTFKHPWVLFLDADERVTPDFISELQSVLPNTKHNGFWLGYQNWFLGKLLRHGDPMQKLALLKVGYGTYEEIYEERWSPLDMEIHEQIIVKGSVGTILSKLEHHDKRSLSAYYARHNDYSTWEAKRYLALNSLSELTSRQMIKYRMLTWPLFPFALFIAIYIVKGGFLDGRQGFYFAIGKMFYFYQIKAKIYEISNFHKEEGIDVV